MTTITYLETYQVPGLPEIGIEDQEQPGKHFFPGTGRKRFCVWWGGCGIGQFETLAEARTQAKARVVHELDARVERALFAIGRAQVAQAAIVHDADPLSAFRKQGDSS